MKRRFQCQTKPWPRTSGILPETSIKIESDIESFFFASKLDNRRRENSDTRKIFPTFLSLTEKKQRFFLRLSAVSLKVTCYDAFFLAFDWIRGKLVGMASTTEKNFFIFVDHLEHFFCSIPIKNWSIVLLCSHRQTKCCSKNSKTTHSPRRWNAKANRSLRAAKSKPLPPLRMSFFQEVCIALACLVIPSLIPVSLDSCAFGSNKYFLLCGLGGIISCGTTHTMVSQDDFLKSTDT